MAVSPLSFAPVSSMMEQMELIHHPEMEDDWTVIRKVQPFRHSEDVTSVFPEAERFIDSSTKTMAIPDRHDFIRDKHFNGKECLLLCCIYIIPNFLLVVMRDKMTPLRFNNILHFLFAISFTLPILGWFFAMVRFRVHTKKDETRDSECRSLQQQTRESTLSVKHRRLYFFPLNNICFFERSEFSIDPSKEEIVVVRKKCVRFVNGMTSEEEYYNFSVYIGPIRGEPWQDDSETTRRSKRTIDLLNFSTMTSELYEREQRHVLQLLYLVQVLNEWTRNDFQHANGDSTTLQDLNKDTTTTTTLTSNDHHQNVIKVV